MVVRGIAVKSGRDKRCKHRDQGKKKAHMRHSHPSEQRHLSPYSVNLVQGDVKETNLLDRALLRVPFRVRDTLQPHRYLAPGINGDAPSIARPLGIVPPDLRSGHDPALRLDGAGPQQRLPVRLARPQGEGARVREQLRGASVPAARGSWLRKG